MDFVYYSRTRFIRELIFDVYQLKFNMQCSLNRQNIQNNLDHVSLQCLSPMLKRKTRNHPPTISYDDATRSISASRSYSLFLPNIITTPQRPRFISPATSPILFPSTSQIYWVRTAAPNGSMIHSLQPPSTQHMPFPYPLARKGRHYGGLQWQQSYSL